MAEAFNYGAIVARPGVTFREIEYACICSIEKGGCGRSFQARSKHADICPACRPKRNAVLSARAVQRRARRAPVQTLSGARP